jgi:hypothetical protein
MNACLPETSLLRGKVLTIAVALLTRFPTDVVFASVGRSPLPTDPFRFWFFSSMPAIAFVVWAQRVRSAREPARHRGVLIALLATACVALLLGFATGLQTTMLSAVLFATWACALIAIVYIVDVPRNRPRRCRRS